MDTTQQFHELRSEDRTGVIRGSKHSEEFRKYIDHEAITRGLKDQTTYTYFKKRCRRERRMAVDERKLHD